MKTKSVFLMLVISALSLVQLRAQNVFLNQQKLVNPCSKDSTKVFYVLDTLGANLKKPISVLWSNGSINNYIFAKANTKIWVRISDAAAKVFTDTLVIQSKTKPILSYETSESSCFGDGSVLLSFLDGTVIDSISWQNNGFWKVKNDSTIITNLSAGIYTGDTLFAGSCVYDLDPTTIQFLPMPKLWHDVSETSSCRNEGVILFYTNDASPITGALFQGVWLNNNNDTLLIPNLGASTYTGTTISVGACIYEIEPISLPMYSFGDFWAKPQRTSNLYTKDGSIEFSKTAENCRVELWANGAVLDQYTMFTGVNEWTFDSLNIGVYSIAVVDKYDCVLAKDIEVLPGNTALFEVADSYNINSAYPENKTLLVKKAAGLVYSVELLNSVGEPIFSSQDYENSPQFVFDTRGIYYLILKSDLLNKPIRKVLVIN